MSSSVNTNIFPGTQDGYNIAIPDFLGADMPCYPPLHADLHAEMGLNDPEVRFAGTGSQLEQVKFRGVTIIMSHSFHK